MLSIVAIGRNEAYHIDRLGRSVEALKEHLDVPVETIFVDSASTDDSRELAAKYFDSVVELESDAHLCASAGRYVGTLEATQPWVFYVDGDMEIRPDFFPVLADLESIDPAIAGVIGLYVHRFDDGSVAIQTFKGAHRGSSAANHFGGAVVLRRQAVVEAGNWDPSIYGKEEMELYVRLGNGKPVVNFVGVPMINHYSEYYSRTELVMRLLMPSAGLGKVFWGYGQSIKALSIKKKLGALIRLDYQVYAFWAALAVACGVGIATNWHLGLTLTVGVFIGFSLWLRPGSIIRYLTLPLSLVTGWFRYFPWFRPRLLKWGSTDTTAR